SNLISFRAPHHTEFDSLDRAHWTVDDWKAVFALVLLFAVMVVASWQRWTQPIVDHGREMNLPARIVAGERLYADVQFLYGPLAPYLNALLYRVFGVSLSILHLAGGICALIVLLTIYWLSRQLMSVAEAACAAGLVLVACAIRFSGNYISPYAYAALYGLVLSLVSLALTVRYWRDERPRWLFGAGICAGLAFTSKWEIALTALSAGILAITLSSLAVRKLLWKDALRFLLPLIAIPAAALGLILQRVPWRTLLGDNHILFSRMPPQLVYFNGLISGIGTLPKSFWYTVSGLGMFALWSGVIVMIGAVGARRSAEGWATLARTGFVLTASGLTFFVLVREIFGLEGDATLLTSVPLVLPLVIVGIVVHLWKVKGRVSKEIGLVLLFAVFAQVSILRVILKVTVSGPYVPFYLPLVLVVVAFLLVSFLPAAVAAPGVLREAVRRTAMFAIALLVIGMAVGSIRRFRTYSTYEVSASRGRFLTQPKIGMPMAEAIKYVAQHTSPEDVLPTLPQTTTINFLAQRRYPFRQEIIHPGFLSDEEGIARLEASRAPLVLVANLLTPEFKDRAFGIDYNAGLWRWINKHYHLVARFDSPESEGAQTAKMLAAYVKR
ncbi:MAG: glycosyltransferase family 39 protein, partial [Acidobacteriota bacterium]